MDEEPTSGPEFLFDVSHHLQSHYEYGKKKIHFSDGDLLGSSLILQWPVVTICQQTDTKEISGTYVCRSETKTVISETYWHTYTNFYYGLVSQLVSSPVYCIYQPSKETVFTESLFPSTHKQRRDRPPFHPNNWSMTSAHFSASVSQVSWDWTRESVDADTKAPKSSWEQRWHEERGTMCLFSTFCLDSFFCLSEHVELRTTMPQIMCACEDDSPALQIQTFIRFQINQIKLCEYFKVGNLYGRRGLP